MTNGKPGGASPGRWSTVFRHLDKHINNPVLKTVIAIGEIAGLVVLIVTGTRAVVHQVTGDADSSRQPSSSAGVTTPAPATLSGTTGSSPPPAPSPTSASTSAPTGPRCWTAAGAVVDCRETHRFEEIPQVPVCDQAAVIGFLGGLAKLDVLIARAAGVRGASCSVDAGHDLRGSAKGVLSSGPAAAWRRCFDQTTNKNVPCSGSHTGEYFATGSLRRGTDGECQVAAFAYLDQTPGNLSEELIVRPLEVKSGSPDSARCSIDARGNHRLTGSVRNLGSRPVPLVDG